MPYKDGQPTLLGFMCSPFMDSITRQPLFGGPYARGIDYQGVKSQIYQIGAVLGRALQNKLDFLEKLSFVPGVADSQRVNDVVQMCKKDAEKNLERYKNEFGHEPGTFDDFGFYWGIGNLVRNAGISLSPRESVRAYLNGDKKLKKLFDMKVDTKGMDQEIMIMLLEGIYFGSTFPELTERMYQNAYEDDGDFRGIVWQDLTVPDGTKVESLEEAESVVLLIVADYASKYYPEYYPELTDTLDLMTLSQGDPLLPKRVQDVIRVEEQHNTELEEFWNSTSPQECASLMVSFLDELRHNWPIEYSQLNPEKIPDAISKCLKDAVTRAYKAGYMRGKGWTSQEQLVDFTLYLGDKLASDLMLFFKNEKSRGDAFASGYVAVAVRGQLKARQK